MSSIIVVYGTGEGQTAKVAHRIVSHLADRGHRAESVDVADVAPDLDLGAWDAVLVGASIHMGKHQKAITSFLRTHGDGLAGKPTGFFQVCLSAATNDEDRAAEAAGYVDDLLAQTNWQPDCIGIFGGALRYSEYGFVKRAMMKRIAREATGDTDTSRDYEYTDWTDVESFVQDFAAFVEDRVAGPVA